MTEIIKREDDFDIIYAAIDSLVKFCLPPEDILVALTNELIERHFFEAAKSIWKHIDAATRKPLEQKYEKALSQFRYNQVEHGSSELTKQHLEDLSDKLIMKLALEEKKFWGVKNVDDFISIMLSKVNRTADLRKIAKNAPRDEVRIAACLKIRGHFRDASAVNKCKCTVCGDQHHPGCPNTGTDWHCSRCGGLVHPIPFTEGLPHSVITFSDGTKESINGYDGHW